MRVKLLNDRGDQKAGSEVDMPDDKAHQLIKVGAAEEVRGGAGGEVQIMRLRFRVSTTLAGTQHRANDVASVEATDEAWQAVNAGQADLDPAPGIGGQPFPPDWMQKAEGVPKHLTPVSGQPGAVQPKEQELEPVKTPAVSPLQAGTQRTVEPAGEAEPPAADASRKAQETKPPEPPRGHKK